MTSPLHLHCFRAIQASHTCTPQERDAWFVNLVNQLQLNDIVSLPGLPHWGPIFLGPKTCGQCIWCLQSDCEEFGFVKVIVLNGKNLTCDGKLTGGHASVGHASTLMNCHLLYHSTTQICWTTCISYLCSVPSVETTMCNWDILIG